MSEDDYLAVYFRNIPRAIAIAVPVVTALYVFMNLAYMTVLTPSEMISAPAVAVLFGERMLGPFSFIIPLGVALSTFGCAMSIQFSTTRFETTNLQTYILYAEFNKLSRLIGYALFLDEKVIFWNPCPIFM